MKRQRTQAVLGGLLVFAGAVFLAAQFNPLLNAWLAGLMSGPLWVLLIAAGLLVVGLLIGAPGMAVPAAIVGGIGAILYWQQGSGDYGSWAYMWTLIPGFVGVGISVAEVLDGKGLRGLREGLPLLVISAVLFVVFSSLLNGPVSIWPLLDTYWPLLLIALGIWIVLQPILRRRQP